MSSYYAQEGHGPYELHDVGDFVTQEGATIRACKLAYATFGKLNAKKDNAILVTTWWTGTSKIMEQIYVGKGRALDPDKYFIVIANQIGAGLSSAPNNTPSPHNATRFPKLRIGDDVRAQHKFLTEKFGIKRLALVFGGSMGAQQTYEWAVRYPDMVARAAPLAGMARNSDHAYLFASTMADALTGDPAYHDGFYAHSHDMHRGLRRVAKLMAVTGWCAPFYQKQVWKGLGFASVEDFLTGFMENFFLPMDPNVLLYTLDKWQHGDVSSHAGGDLKKALGSIKAKVSVMPIENDLIFPPQDCEAEAKMISGALYRPIRSVCGHLGLFAVDATYNADIDKHLNELLAVKA